MARRKADSETIRRRYDRVAFLYDLVESPMEAMGMAKWREKLWQRARGRVLEIGVGTGKNMAWYPPDAEVTAIDLSPKMLARARRRAERDGIDVSLLEMDVEKLGFTDNYFDTVIATCVFCSVPDPVRGLKEVARVCKPDGQVLLLEHVRSSGALLGPLMDLLNPLIVRLYGANINRPTADNIRMAGLKIINETNFSRDIVKEFIATV
ncbi:MAG: class I SAM-dependent methyltransferase [Firmicutes bacterium]|nr:class I SAM-dependent methyltransferase [Bacillota bacterium]